MEAAAGTLGIGGAQFMELELGVAGRQAEVGEDGEGPAREHVNLAESQQALAADGAEH